MKKLSNLHVFSDETLHEHDMRIATAVHQATALSAARQAVRMTPPQVMRASQDGGKGFYWSQEKIEKFVSQVENEL